MKTLTLLEKQLCVDCHNTNTSEEAPASLLTIQVESETVKKLPQEI